MTDDLVKRGRYACNMGLSNADLFRLASDMADRIEALTAELAEHADVRTQIDHRIEELVAEVDALTADNARLREIVSELRRRLAGGCDANHGGDHLVIKQGTYAFCGNCGESLRGERFCHVPRAALTGKETK